MTTVTIERETVSLTPQEAADHVAAIKAILEKYAPHLLTPAPIPATIEVKQSQRRGKQ